MIVVRCKDCNKELSSHPGKTKSCGCSNMMTLIGDSLTARDLSRVVMIDSGKKKKDKNVLSSEDIAWQEQRRKRKVRKLDFDVR
jgi:hypothetical protein|tara:strand:+ start:365 stop:616 length:252 start_codon:yes stop_codon:yes gene_type:complete